MKRLIVFLVTFTVFSLIVRAQQEENGQYACEEVKLEIRIDSAADSAYLYVVNDVYYIHELGPGEVIQSIKPSAIIMIAAYQEKDSEGFIAYSCKTGEYAPMIQGIIVLETINGILPSALERKNSSSF